jgi:hypothetical protein
MRKGKVRSMHTAHDGGERVGQYQQHTACERPTYGNNRLELKRVSNTHTGIRHILCHKFECPMYTFK